LTKTRRSRCIGMLEKRLEKTGGELMKAWRTQARRHDRVGDLSYHGLETLHGGVQFAARSLSRLEEATQPPHRTARPEPHAPALEPAHRAPHASTATPAARPHPAPQPHEPEASAS
jgi:hypothetical protein